MTTSNRNTLMIAGGGTGGHIYPAIAIAQEYLRRDPSRKVVFVGTEYGLEKTIVPRAGFPIEFISVGGLKGKSLAQTLRNLLRLPLGFGGAWKVITRHNPSVILGVGGYSSGPVVLMGSIRKIPTLIHEANAAPGLTNRILARFASAVAVAFPGALEVFKRPGQVTGNPVRAEFFTSTVKPRSERGDGKFRLLIFGGSQGSRILNDTFTGALLFLSRLRDRLEIVHQTGPGEHAKVVDAYRSSAFRDARVVPYLEAMSNELGSADLVISRSGAMTIGELTALGRGAILVPFALATHNHQEMNARVLEKAGGAIVITESQLTPEKLAAVVSDVLSDPQRAARMGKAARTLATPQAAGDIVAMIERLGQK